MKYTLMDVLYESPSATLVQRIPNEDNCRVVQCASRALSDVEQRYSKLSWRC